jgi:fructose-1-phosphate kinase PfkB-like protein
MSIVTITLNPCVDKTLSVERVVADRKLAGEDVHEYSGIETLRGLPVSTEYVVVSGGLPDAAPGEWS